MVDFFFALTGFVCGGLAMMVAFDLKRKRLRRMQTKNSIRADDYRRQIYDLQIRQEEFAQEMQREKESNARQLQERVDKIRGHEATAIAHHFRTVAGTG